MRLLIITKIIFILFIAVVYLLLDFYVGNAVAQDKKGSDVIKDVTSILKNINSDNWYKSCKKSTKGKEVCNIKKTLNSEQKNGANVKISTMDFQTESDKQGKALLMISVPLGSVLKEGVSVQIDAGKQFKTPFAYCLSDGCYSNLIVDNNSIDKFKKGGVTNIRITSISGKTILLKFSLEGFTAAFDGSPREVSQQLVPNKK